MRIQQHHSSSKDLIQEPLIERNEQPIVIDFSEEISSLQEGLKRTDKQIFEMKSKIEKVHLTSKERQSEPSLISLGEVKLLHNLESRMPDCEDRIINLEESIKSFDKIWKDL